MASTFRLYGPEIGEATAVVDADVTGVTLNGEIELTPADGSLDPFVTSGERLEELIERDLAYDKSEIDTSAPIWKAIEDVETHYEQTTDDGEPFIEAAKTLFQGAA